jgi:thioredoxin reductase (NADPH)
MPATETPPQTLSGSDEIAFPHLDATDLAELRPLADCVSFENGEIVFRAGDADFDLFVVDEGSIEIINPSDDNRDVVTHTPGQLRIAVSL